MRVPPRAVPIFTATAKLTKKVREGLLASVEEQSFYVSLEALHRRVADAAAPAFDSDDATALVGEIFALRGYADSHGYELDDVAASISMSSDLELTATQRTNFEQTLLRLLTAPAVRGLGKAIALSQEQERLLHTVRIFTDARPVFDDVDSKPIGSIITQRLVLEYMKNGRVETIEIGLSGEDVSNLREAVDRAERKAAALDKMMKGAELPVFHFEDEELED